tara:strand:- start:1387 stop:2562 length:1176 start_codon:yes stop_codon:yes gene_type:complete
MTSVINNSNSNSALVNTLIASDSLVNPNVYTIKQITPPHAMTYASNLPSTESYGANGNVNFQLNKYGIISQILFNYKKKTAAADDYIGANDIFDCISKIDLLSSSRVVSTLTNFDLMAQFSNLSESKLLPIKRSSLRQPAASASAVDFCIPLVFGFMQDVNTQLNSSFLEPLSIRVTWGTVNKSFSAGDAELTNAVISEASLNIRYKNYNEESVSKILSENYDKPQLNQLSTRFYDENTQPVTASSTLTEVAVELKNTDCVQNFYVIVREVGKTQPLAISDIEFTGSGQQILKMNEFQIQYSKIDHDGFSVGQDIITGANSLFNIAKLQMGLYDSTTMSNMVSLREINAPKITIKFVSVDATNYEVVVVEETAAIYSTSSASGRLDLALSN